MFETLRDNPRLFAVALAVAASVGLFFALSPLTAALGSLSLILLAIKFATNAEEMELLLSVVACISGVLAILNYLNDLKKVQIYSEIAAAAVELQADGSLKYKDDEGLTDLFRKCTMDSLSAPAPSLIQTAADLLLKPAASIAVDLAMTPPEEVCLFTAVDIARTNPDFENKLRPIIERHQGD